MATILGTHDAVFDAVASLLGRLTAADLRSSPRWQGAPSVGDELAACIERYRRFLDGLPNRWIDYQRVSDTSASLERQPSDLLDLRRRMRQETVHLPPMTPLKVRDDGAGWLDSTLGRECSVLARHAVYRIVWIPALLKWDAFAASAPLLRLAAEAGLPAGEGTFR